jgi:hypothetical protein
LPFRQGSHLSFRPTGFVRSALRFWAPDISCFRGAFCIGWQLPGRSVAAAVRSSASLRSVAERRERQLIAQASGLDDILHGAAHVIDAAFRRHPRQRHAAAAMLVIAAEHKPGQGFRLDRVEFGHQFRKQASPVSSNSGLLKRLGAERRQSSHVEVQRNRRSRRWQAVCGEHSAEDSERSVVASYQCCEVDLGLVLLPRGRRGCKTAIKAVPSPYRLALARRIP